MKLLILISLLAVSCAKTSKNGKPTINPVVPKEEVKMEAPAEISTFEENFENTLISTKRKVIFSENLKDITSVELEVTKPSKLTATYKQTTHQRRVCYNNAAPKTCSGTWCFHFQFACSDDASHKVSPLSKGTYARIPWWNVGVKKVAVTYRSLTGWKENTFKDDLTLEELGVEIFINDKFIDIDKKDIEIAESGDVNKLMIKMSIPQVEDGNLKVTAKPVYDNATVVTGKVSPALYACKTINHPNLTAYVRLTSYISNGRCISRTTNPEDYVWIEGGIASKSENITPRNKFDLKLKVQATRQEQNVEEEI